MSVTVNFDGDAVIVTIPEDVEVRIVRRASACQTTGRIEREVRAWEAVVTTSEYAELERDLCRRAQTRGWVVEPSRSTGPHAQDINIYPPPGEPQVRIAAFYAPSGRVAFPNRVTEEDATRRHAVAPVYDNLDKPNETFAGLRIRLREDADVDTALELADLVYRRIIG